MRQVISTLLLLLMVFCLTVSRSQADVDIGLSIGKEGIKGFYLAIGEHYQVTQKEVVIVKERKISDEEMPVVFFLAERARVKPRTIIELRIGGKSWMQIVAHFGLAADIFYVPVKKAPGPPYGKAYGHFKNKKTRNRDKIVLTDTEVVNFVNLKFLSEHYGHSADEIIKMRADGNTFVAIHSKVKKTRDKKQKAGEVASKEKSKGKGKK